MNDDFRCSSGSLADRELLAGTAPTDESWLFVEYAGAWGSDPVRASRLPTEVRDFLAGLIDVRVQLIRRVGGASGPGLRVFRVSLHGEPVVKTALLDDPTELFGLMLEGVCGGSDPSGESDPPQTPAKTWVEHDGPLWLVCTNGKRDRCCAELGRPIAARLAEVWPEETWETTHLGGHRFSGTLLALPSGVTLGRLDPDSAEQACSELLAGRHPLEWSRGRAGWSAAAQVADLELRVRWGWHDQAAVTLIGQEAGDVQLATPQGTLTVSVESAPGPARQLSCGSGLAKATTSYSVTGYAAAGVRKG